jgi:hypothetical protein
MGVWGCDGGGGLKSRSLRLPTRLGGAEGGADCAATETLGLLDWLPFAKGRELALDVDGWAAPSPWRVLLRV